MGFKKIVGKTQERTSELNREFIEEITKLYHTFSSQDITRHLDSDRKVLALGGRYLIVALVRERDINWDTLCNYMIVDVSFSDDKNPSNDRVATLLIEDDGGWDNNSWKKLKEIMNGDVQPNSTKHHNKLKLKKEPRLKEGILIRIKGTDFFYSKDEFDDKSLNIEHNSLKLYKGSEVIKYFNLNYVVTIDFEYNPEVNDYAELKDYLRSNNKERGVKHGN